MIVTFARAFCVTCDRARLHECMFGVEVCVYCRPLSNKLDLPLEVN